MNHKMFNAVLETQSYHGETELMNRTIRRFAQQYGADIAEEDGNLYVVKGKADVYPCVVAHTDTVHPILPSKEYRIRYSKGRYFAFNHAKGDLTGIGGDDKVGIFIALMMLERFPAVKLAFFRDEEIGCVGSGVADMSFFRDVAFVLQCDRQGNDDFVQSIYGTKLYGKDFAKAIAPYLRKYKYFETTGALTDVVTLKENDLHVAVANMSCGYFHPHSKYEYINIKDVRRCLDLVTDIVRNLGHKRWTHKYKTNRAITYINGKPYKGSGRNWDKTTRKNWWEELDDENYGIAYPYGSLSRTDPDLIVLPDGSIGRKLPDGSVIHRILGPKGAEVEDIEDVTFSNPDGIVCPRCEMSLHVEYDDTVGFYFCGKCKEYVFLDEEDDNPDDALAASAAILKEWEEEAVDVDLVPF